MNKKYISLLCVSLLFIFIFLTGCSSTLRSSSNSSNWEVVGTSLFDNLSASAINVDLATITGNVPCVFYQTTINATTRTAIVKKFNGTNWIVMESIANAWDPNIASDTDGNPAIAYLQANTGSQAVVKHYNSTTATWDSLGGATLVNAKQPILAYDKNDNLYVAYVDGSNYITVKKYLSSSNAWTTVGSAGFAGPVSDMKVQFKVADNGTLYVLYNKDNGDSTSSLYCVRYVP